MSVSSWYKMDPRLRVAERNIRLGQSRGSSLGLGWRNGGNRARAGQCPVAARVGPHRLALGVRPIDRDPPAGYTQQLVVVAGRATQRRGAAERELASLPVATRATAPAALGVRPVDRGSPEAYPLQLLRRRRGHPAPRRCRTRAGQALPLPGSGLPARLKEKPTFGSSWCLNQLNVVGIPLCREALPRAPLAAGEMEQA